MSNATTSNKKLTTKVSSSTSNKNSDTYVYVVKGGHYYHKVGCKYLDKTETKITLKEAIAKGYKPCMVCYPYS